MQSQIRNPQSTIHNRSSWRPRVFLRLRSGQAHPATYHSGTETNPAVPRDELPGGPPTSPERAGSRWRAGTPILFALALLRSVPQAGSQFRGLATAIHETTGLAVCAEAQKVKVCITGCNIQSAPPFIQPVHSQNGGFTYLQEKALQRILKITWFEH